MRQRRKRWSLGLASAGVVVVLALGTALALPHLKDWFPRARSPLEGVRTTVVRRTDMDVTLTTGGKVESTKRTEIECELQRLEASVRGPNLMGSGASTMLSVIPDGTVVKKGDVICEFDSSEYVEMLRQQKMTVEREQADFRMAELNLDVAKMAVTEYKDGTLVEAFKEYAGTIKLGEASLERLSDRLKWARRMLSKGYIAASQLSNEEFNQRKAAFDLKKSQVDHDVFRRFTAPRILRDLQSKVFAAEAIKNYQAQRLQRNLDRQALLERQIEKCTIRAPHDGLVIYINDRDRQLRIEEGMMVYQGQDLFYLPDLEHMVAMAMIHESVASQVKPGMRARVRIEGVRDQLLEGRVKSIAQLPTQNFFNELRYFYTEVVLDEVPKGVLPGMTAEVEIATDERSDVLSIPIESIAYEEGQEVCYVAREDSVERREIKVGQSTRSRIEVIEGLDEGESIVLNPAQYDTDLEAISPFDPDEASRWSSPAPVSSLDTE